MTAERFVGRAMRRTEDLRFVTGRGCYVDDFTRPGLTHAVLVRSAHAHARVSRIDATRALTLGGVLAVLTSADLPAMTAIPLRLAPLPGFDRYLQPPLAGTRVRYVGEPVAVVVAEDRHVAEDAAACVAVEYGVGTAVVDAHRALTDDVVIQHGQAHGAALQGLSGTFLEELVYDDAGQLLTGTLAEYVLPTASAFPRIDAITLEEVPSTLNPLGAKGAGEGGIVATGAAAANAVAAALAPLGVVVRDLPLSPANIARWVREAQRGR